MATPMRSKEVLQATAELYRKHFGSIAEIVAETGLSHAGVSSRVSEARRKGYLAAHESATYLRSQDRLSIVAPVIALSEPSPIASSVAAVVPAEPNVHGKLLERARGILRARPVTLAELAQALGTTEGVALDLGNELRRAGANVHRNGEHWSIESAGVPAFAAEGDRIRIRSDAAGIHRFGVVADSHLGSKYERMDCLNDIYDRLARAGITQVFHCGNWIEGEARFNRTELKVHGMGEQLRYLAEHYPQRPGITTYAVTGDDHEGWYAQREGVDIGRLAEDEMRRHGRTDWVNLGFMEAHVDLVHGASQTSAVMAVVHPGGGTAYADSYVVQKIIESLEGGEKPAVALYGHYHKMLAGEYRNVFWVLVPSTKDQDIFMRKKRIRSIVGGGIVELEQDAATGAIVGFTPKLWRYFNKSYYDGRWSHERDVNLPDRMLA